MFVGVAGTPFTLFVVVDTGPLDVVAIGGVAFVDNGVVISFDDGSSSTNSSFNCCDSDAGCSVCSADNGSFFVCCCCGGGGNSEEGDWFVSDWSASTDMGSDSCFNRSGCDSSGDCDCTEDEMGCSADDNEDEGCCCCSSIGFSSSFGCDCCSSGSFSDWNDSVCCDGGGVKSEGFSLIFWLEIIIIIIK